MCVSPFRRPTIETAPTNAKAGCLYPNNGRALRDAVRVEDEAGVPSTKGVL